MKIKATTVITLLAALTAAAAEPQTQHPDSLLARYRDMALGYNHDLKAAQRNVAATIELEKAARKDLAPTLSGSADFRYTGNPLELTLDLPGTDGPAHFEGQHLRYGLSLSFMQPVYAGGRLLENIRMAQHRQQLARHEADYFRSAVCYQTDLQYWSAVARAEMMAVAQDYRNAIDTLTCIIRERVEAGLAEPQDLLMAEVKRNEADYQLLRTQNDYATGIMALNSLIGVPLDHTTPVPGTVPVPDRDEAMKAGNPDSRPEIGMAREQVNLAQSEGRLAVSKYRPQLYVGAGGSFSAPGYDFTHDMDPNYGVQATLSVPITQWGKKRNERQACELQTDAARDRLNRTLDQVALEVATARLSLEQALEQVSLTGNSLEKARQNEAMALERYVEGNISVVEVIEAQTYRLAAQTHFVQAKVSAQGCRSALAKALNSYVQP